MKNAQRLALATSILTVALIALGAYVRASGSGLGCPNWPLCTGAPLPPNARHAIIETSHRYVATTVGILVIATAVMAWRHYRKSTFIVWTSLIAVPMVGIQGILGAITVYRELPATIVATHMVFAMIVLAFELAVFVSMYLEDPAHREKVTSLANASRRPGAIAFAGMIWLAAVTWIGGYMAAYGASTACSGWPLCNGSPLPSSNNQEIVHMIHRYLAGLLVFFIAAFAITAWRRRHELFWAVPVTTAVVVLYVLQVMVGAFNVWYTFPQWLTVSHTLIAACVWFTLSFPVLFTFYAPVPERSREKEALPKAGVTA